MMNTHTLLSTSSAPSSSTSVQPDCWPVSEDGVMEFAVLVGLLRSTVADPGWSGPFSQPEKKSRVASGHENEECVSDEIHARIFVI